MTEQEFKTNYVKSYLAAYESAVKSKPVGGASSVDQLLDTANQYAERAWQQYLKENK
jgi:hypothetical protein